jgi:dehydrogenase/reductase SDR family protein 4
MQMLIHSCLLCDDSTLRAHPRCSFFTSTSAVRLLHRSKTALLGVARNLAHEWAAVGVRVNAIAPGIIKTQFSELLWKNEAATEAALQRIPLGRLGESHEIASVAAFLVSSDANYVTGETIVVSGGMQASRL